MKKDEMYAWAAGFLDAEGCFHLASLKACKAPLYRTASMSASQTKREPLECLKFLFGGKVSDNTKKTFAGSSVYQWRISKRELLCKAILNIYPYLVLKKDQAEALLFWCEMPSCRGRRYTECETIMKEIIILRYEKCKNG